MNVGERRAPLQTRVSRLNVAVQVALVLLAAGYWSVQVTAGSTYRELAENNRLRKRAVEAPRGLINDRHGRPLVENVPSYSLLLDRSLSSDLDASLAFAAEVLGRPREDLAAVLDAARQPAYQPLRLADDLTLEQVARVNVEHLEHPELEIGVAHLRLYRHAHQTAHVLGYLGEVTSADVALPGSTFRPGDMIGKKGVERLYEDHLRGESGERVVVVNSRGRLIDEYRQEPARAGQSLTLALDLELQQEAARLLEDKVGAIVALDPRQGDVLALVSSPSFNPNRFERGLDRDEWRALLEDDRHPLQNRALQSAYPPGSVFKIVMAVAGLDLGLIDPSTTTAYCRGYSMIYNHRYRCWNRGGHGTVDLRKSLRHSCNVFFHQLGQKMDIDSIARYARLFGLGEPTGIDLRGEKPGLVPDTAWSLEQRGARWFPGETISVSTGQGPVLVTPLQVATMMATLARGHRVTPSLVRGAGAPPRPAAGLPAGALALVRQGLLEVVTPGGTGADASVEGLAIAGKTGTAQVVNQRTWTKNEELPPEHRDHAWFASFAPFDDPQLVVVVLVEHGGAGSRAAAPLAKALYEKHFRKDPAQLAAASPASAP